MSAGRYVRLVPHYRCWWRLVMWYVWARCDGTEDPRGRRMISSTHHYRHNSINALSATKLPVGLLCVSLLLCNIREISNCIHVKAHRLLNHAVAWWNANVVLLLSKVMPSLWGLITERARRVISVVIWFNLPHFGACLREDALPLPFLSIRAKKEKDVRAFRQRVFDVIEGRTCTEQSY